MRLYAINADYRPSNKGNNWYYVRANSKGQARRLFMTKITWLDIYEIKLLPEDDAAAILAAPEKHIII